MEFYLKIMSFDLEFLGCPVLYSILTFKFRPHLRIKRTPKENTCTKICQNEIISEGNFGSNSHPHFLSLSGVTTLASGCPISIQTQSNETNKVSIFGTGISWTAFNRRISLFLKKITIQFHWLFILFILFWIKLNELARDSSKQKQKKKSPIKPNSHSIQFQQNFQFNNATLKIVSCSNELGLRFKFFWLVLCD